MFKEVQSAFEVIREQYDSGKVQSFTADTFQVGPPPQEFPR